MAAAKSVKSGYRLLGAIAEAADGPVFFKLTGPPRRLRPIGSNSRLCSNRSGTRLGNAIDARY